MQQDNLVFAQLMLIIPASTFTNGTPGDSAVKYNSANSNYTGAVSANDFLAAPSVIQGVVQ